MTRYVILLSILTLVLVACQPALRPFISRPDPAATLVIVEVEVVRAVFDVRVTLVDGSSDAEGCRDLENGEWECSLGDAQAGEVLVLEAMGPVGVGCLAQAKSRAGMQVPNILLPCRARPADPA